MNPNDILRMAREAHRELVTKDYPGHAGQLDPWTMRLLERFAALIADRVHKTYNPIGTVAGGATERTFMHPSVGFILPTGLQLYARIEVREEDKV